MSTTPGSEFSLWEGDIVGKNLEFEENKLIKQQWYFEGQDEESIVTITLEEKGEYTHAHVEHTNIPDEAYDEMKEGWKVHFFGTVKEFFK